MALSREKHRLDDDDNDNDADNALGQDTASSSLAARRGRGKRRRVSSDMGGFEPSFGALSLSNGHSQLQHPATSVERRRESTPYPGGGISLSSSKPKPQKPALHAPATREVRMERHDPARPHVVFVDSLSDSDNDEDGATEGDELDDSSSIASDSDVIPPTSRTSREQKRPIRINSRLRDQLRRQAILQYGPIIEEVLADSPLRNGGAGIQERGLVLYRPLTWGIVEEPEAEEREDTHSLAHTPSDPQIVELEDDEEVMAQGSRPHSALTHTDSQGSLDDSMDID